MNRWQTHFRASALVVIGLSMGCMGSKDVDTSHCDALVATDGMTAGAQCLWLISETLGEQGSMDGNNLLADSARIVMTRRYPDGQTQTMEMTGADMKDLAGVAGCAAKARGDRSSYSDTTFEEDADGTVLISSTRYAHSKNYSSPAYFRVGLNAQNQLRFIYMEMETIP